MNAKMKRLICLIVTVLLLLCLVACGKTPNSNSATGNSSNPGTHSSGGSGTDSSSKGQSTNKTELPGPNGRNTLILGQVSEYSGWNGDVNVYFGKYSDYSGFEEGNRSDGIPVDEGKFGGIMFFHRGDDIFILSDDIIYLNPNSSNMFQDSSSRARGDASYKKIIFNNISTTTVENMSSMFSMYKGESLDLSSFDTSNVKDMDGMFLSCESLTSLDLSGFDTSKVTDMGFMFDACKSLTSLDLSGFDTSDVTDMGFMFDGCESLTAIDLSSFDTSHVTDMEKMFLDCQSLKSLDLSSFDTKNVTYMDGMFEGCHANIKTGPKWTLGNPDDLK